MIIRILFSYIIFTFFIFGNLYSKDLIILGNKKLDSDSLQSLTSIDLYKNNFDRNEIQIIQSELYNSELIFNVFIQENLENFVLTIVESKIIENIYINGNLFINDENIINNLVSKPNKLFNQNTLINDIDLINKIYLSNGYKDISVKTTTEFYSEDRINLIFDIFENKPSKIIKIDFQGNNFFSDRFLRSLINTSEESFLNFFSSGVSLDDDVFKFDTAIIKNKYLNYGFNDIKVTYLLNNPSNRNDQILTFYISEGSKYLIKDIQYNFSSETLKHELGSIINNLNNYVSNNDYQLDIEKIEDYVIKLNDSLISKNIFKSFVNFEINFTAEGYNILIYEEFSDPLIVNSIKIFGNGITKDATIRNNIAIEPGDYYNETLINRSLKNLQQKKYINNAKINIIEDNQNVDINFNIEENKKTGNFLIGGNFSGDIGLGLSTSLKDNNLFGTGNELNVKLDYNEENIRFDLNYIYYPSNRNNISYEYKIFNLDRDLKSSYGYKSKEYGAGIFFNFDYSENLNFTPGLEYRNSEGYSAQNNLDFINDNIKNFNQYIFNLNISHDTTNDIFYPTNGYKNSLFIKYVPRQSTLPYYSIIIQNESYYEFVNSSDFIFNQNIFGFADTLDANDKISSINTFSLGGLSFKGFDYRGIGPLSSNYYLGGNKFFTSTIGYGSSFLFDEDNVNIKLFYSLGSLWGSDYTNDNDIKLRSSLGLSFDIMTPLLPISLSYAIPINKQPDDRLRNFNFSIGTSF